ncbi:MAG: orotidine-5'-phosphate decarboxylase [Bacteroidales bacterium]|nr:orotidine-5'-phosphate decarboxylase [Bacteroidales bacterium]
MSRNHLFDLIREKKSFLCIGLDPEAGKIPHHLREAENFQFEFNKRIIDSTIDITVAYKLNAAFYESEGSAGWISMEKTIEYLGQYKNEIFTIADAKRGDIGNTSRMYSQAFLEKLGFDAITVSPYMGEDSVAPFLGSPDKWIIILALTSNAGSKDFQMIENTTTGKKLYEEVLLRSSAWGTADNIMYVAGATKAEKLADIRKIIPDHFLLVPGVGAQGGSLEQVAKYGLNSQCGLIVNSSRGIIFASSGLDFAEKAREEAIKMQKAMSAILDSMP